MNKDTTKSTIAAEPLEILSILSKVAYHYRRQLSNQSTNYGLSPNEGGLLLMLYKFSDISTASQISKEMGVTKSLISRSVEHLSNSGYLNIKSDDADRRVQHLVLTEKAKDICEKIYADSKEIYDKTVGNLTEKEKLEMAVLLNKIADNFENI